MDKTQKKRYILRLSRMRRKNYTQKGDSLSRGKLSKMWSENAKSGILPLQKMAERKNRRIMKFLLCRELLFAVKEVVIKVLGTIKHDSEIQLAGLNGTSIGECKAMQAMTDIIMEFEQQTLTETCT